LGSFMFLMFRRDLKLGREHDTIQPDDTTTGETDKG